MYLSAFIIVLGHTQVACARSDVGYKKKTTVLKTHFSLQNKLKLFGEVIQTKVCQRKQIKTVEMVEALIML